MKQYSVKIIWFIMLIIIYLEIDFVSEDISNLAYVILCVGIGIIFTMPNLKNND